MTLSQQAADEISNYLLTGMHHSTPQGQMAITGIIARYLLTQQAEQAKFWEDCMRDALRDRDQQIITLKSL